jgi:hypothetical protein
LAGSGILYLGSGVGSSRKNPATPQLAAWNAPVTRDRSVSGITAAKIADADVEHHDAEPAPELRREQRPVPLASSRGPARVEHEVEEVDGSHRDASAANQGA